MVLSAEELASRGSKQKGGASGTYAATQARQQAMMDATAANPVAYHPVGRTRQKKREHVPGFGQSCWADLSQSFCLFKQHLEFLLHSTPYPEDLERTAEWRFHEYGSHSPPPPKAPKARSAAKELRKTERELKRATKSGDEAAEVQPPPSARGPYAARRMGALPRDYATTDAYNDWVVGGANPEVRETAKSRQNQREAEGMPIPPPWIIQARRALYAQEEAQREAKQQQQKDAAAGSAGQQGVLTPGARKILQESAFRSSLRPRSPSAVPASTQPAEEADPSMPKPLAFDSDSDEDINPPGTSLARGGSGAQLSPAAGGAGDAAPALSQEALAALKAERAERRRAKSRALDARGREVEQRTLPAPQRLPRPSKTRARPRASQAELQA